MRVSRKSGHGFYLGQRSERKDMATPITLNGTTYQIDDAEFQAFLDKITTAVISHLPLPLASFDPAAFQAAIVVEIQRATGAVTLDGAALDALTRAVQDRLEDEFTNLHDHLDSSGQGIEARIGMAQTSLEQLLTEDRLTEIVRQASKSNTGTFIGLVVLLLLAIGASTWYNKVRFDGIESKLAGVNLSKLTLVPDPTAPGMYKLEPEDTSVKAPTTPPSAAVVPTAPASVAPPSAAAVPPTAPAVPSAIPSVTPSAPAATMTKAQCAQRCAAKSAGLLTEADCSATPACAALP